MPEIIAACGTPKVLRVTITNDEPSTIASYEISADCLPYNLENKDEVVCGPFAKAFIKIADGHFLVIGPDQGILICTDTPSSSYYYPRSTKWTLRPHLSFSPNILGM